MKAVAPVQCAVGGGRASARHVEERANGQHGWPRDHVHVDFFCFVSLHTLYLHPTNETNNQPIAFSPPSLVPYVIFLRLFSVTQSLSCRFLTPPHPTIGRSLANIATLYVCLGVCCTNIGITRQFKRKGQQLTDRWTDCTLRTAPFVVDVLLPEYVFGLLLITFDVLSPFIFLYYARLCMYELILVAKSENPRVCLFAWFPAPSLLICMIHDIIASFFYFVNKAQQLKRKRGRGREGAWASTILARKAASMDKDVESPKSSHALYFNLGVSYRIHSISDQPK